MRGEETMTEMAVETFDPDRLARALDWIDRVGYAATDDVAVVVALEAAQALLDGLGVAWCEKHRSRFLEEQPSERSLCLYSLHEDNFNAVGWEDCAPVRARVVVEGGRK